MNDLAEEGPRGGLHLLGRKKRKPCLAPWGKRICKKPELASKMGDRGCKSRITNWL